MVSVKNADMREAVKRKTIFDMKRKWQIRELRPYDRAKRWKVCGLK